VTQAKDAKQEVKNREEQLNRLRERVALERNRNEVRLHPAGLPMRLFECFKWTLPWYASMVIYSLRPPLLRNYTKTCLENHSSTGINYVWGTFVLGSLSMCIERSASSSSISLLADCKRVKERAVEFGFFGTLLFVTVGYTYAGIRLKPWVVGWFPWTLLRMGSHRASFKLNRTFPKKMHDVPSAANWIHHCKAVAFPLFLAFIMRTG